MVRGSIEYLESPIEHRRFDALVGARHPLSKQLARSGDLAKMGGGNAQKSAMARKKAQEKAAKEGKGARAPQPTPRAHPRSPPQF